MSLKAAVTRSLVGAAADVEEVGRLAAVELDDVHGRHGEAGAVDHAADVAVELDVVEAVLGGLELGRVFLVRVAQRLDLLVAEERVVVEVHLGVERQHLAVAGDDQRIDLDERGVELDEGLVQRGDELRARGATWSPSRPSPKAMLAGVKGHQPGRRIDRDLEDLLRRVARRPPRSPCRLRSRP